MAKKKRTRSRPKIKRRIYEFVMLDGEWGMYSTEGELNQNTIVIETPEDSEASRVFGSGRRRKSLDYVCFTPNQAVNQALHYAHFSVLVSRKFLERDEKKYDSCLVAMQEWRKKNHYVTL